MASADGRELAERPTDMMMGARGERRDEPSDGGGAHDDVDDEPGERERNAIAETRVPTFANSTECDLLVAKMREIVEGGGGGGGGGRVGPADEPDEQRKCQQTTPPPTGRPKSSSDSLGAGQEPSGKAAHTKRRCAHHSRRSSAAPAEWRPENRTPARSAGSSEPSALAQQPPQQHHHHHHYQHRHADDPSAHRCHRHHHHHHHHHHHNHHRHEQQPPNQAPVQQSKRNSLAHPGAEPAGKGPLRRSQNESKSSSNQSVSLARESIQSSSIGDNPSQEQPASRSFETLNADGAKRAARPRHPHHHHHHHHHHARHNHNQQHDHEQQQLEPQADNQRRHQHHHRCHHRHKKRLLSSDHSANTTTPGDQEAGGGGAAEEPSREAPESTGSVPGSSFALEAADLCAHHRRQAHAHHHHHHQHQHRHDRRNSHQHRARSKEELPASSKPPDEAEQVGDTQEASSKHQHQHHAHHHQHHHHQRRHCHNHSGQHHNDGRRRNSRARPTRTASKSDEQSKENVALIEDRPAKDDGRLGETGDRPAVVEMETEADKPRGVTLWTSSLDPVERSTDSNLITAIELASSEAVFAAKGEGSSSRAARDEPALKSAAGRRAEPANEAVLTEHVTNGAEMSIELDRKPPAKQLSAFEPPASVASEAPPSVGQQQSATTAASCQLIDVASSAAPATDRRCRLCWCCCFPCPTVSTRTVTAAASRNVGANKGRGERNNSMANNICAPGVPLEEIRAWSESFDRLMKCPEGRKVFQDFLRCEYSEENILFWTACEELRAEKEAKSIANKARDIYEDYISILSSKEVSLDSRVRDVINQNIKRPTSHIFDEAQLQIYTLMHRDSYPRFINSPMYKRLAQLQQAPSRRTSSAANNAAVGV